MIPFSFGPKGWSWMPNFWGWMQSWNTHYHQCRMRQVKRQFVAPRNRYSMTHHLDPLCTMWCRAQIRGSMGNEVSKYITFNVLVCSISDTEVRFINSFKSVYMYCNWSFNWKEVIKEVNPQSLEYLTPGLVSWSQCYHQRWWAEWQDLPLPVTFNLKHKQVDKKTTTKKKVFCLCLYEIKWMIVEYCKSQDTAIQSSDYIPIILKH